MPDELTAASAGGFIGGVLGVLGAMFASYWGPRKLEEWRKAQEDEKIDGPRKRLLKKCLDDPRFPDGRTLDTLSRVTGTRPEECRRLLIEIGARGIRLANDAEGWVLISKKPIEEG